MTGCVYRRKKNVLMLLDVCTWAEGQVNERVIRARGVGKKVTSGVNV